MQHSARSQLIGQRTQLLNAVQGHLREFGIIGAAAGSLFVFKGVYRAVLISYPSRSDKDTLIQGAATGH